MDRNDQAWAVFRCSLLKPVLLGEIPASERGAYFRKLSQQEHLLPNGTRKKISARTLRRWWKQLREGGVEAMFRQQRTDRGQPHRKQKQSEILARAVELKREQPRRSAHVINQILRQEFGRDVPASTLYRHLRRAGATRLKLGVSEQKIRCRWSRDHSNALWVGDFEHGPAVMHREQAVKTHLSAWIDCHSRYIVEARYYVRENLDILIDSLLRAWGHHGASGELYVDNAKIYHASALKLACAKLNIRLLHRPARDPAPGGLIERFFQTLQGQLEAEVEAAGLLTLAELNQALQAWLRTAYHNRIHSQTRQTPGARYEAGRTVRREVDLSAVEQFFHRRVTRIVDRDHCDVTVDGKHFAVDASLRGDRLIVQLDPFGRDDDLQEVELYSENGIYLGVGRRYLRQRGYHAQPPARPTTEPIEPHYLKALAADEEAELQQQRAAGIDYQSAQQRNLWSFQSWARQFARLLGRDGISSFNVSELDALRAFHAKHDRVNETVLRKAFARAEARTIPQVLLQLQLLLYQRRNL
jgi:transposase InsO family protein